MLSRNKYNNHGYLHNSIIFPRSLQICCKFITSNYVYNKICDKEKIITVNIWKMIMNLHIFFFKFFLY